MADTQDDPIFVVKLAGILHPEDIERYARKFEEQLPGRVIVTDNSVEDVRKVTDMQPRDAIVTVHHKRKRFDYMSSDGNTPVFRDYEEDEHVPAKVWPVSMGEHELLVEYEDGRLDVAELWDIELMVDQ